MTDDASCRHLFDALLNLHGYAVMFAESSQQGLELVRQTCPEAVVLDLNLPEMRANSMVREVRRLMASQPVIVLSGRGTSEEECVRMLGPTEVIDNSETPHTLVKILGRMINHRRPEEAPTLRLNHGEWRVIS
jgi:DNA-binding response OmpR family regulator